MGPCYPSNETDGDCDELSRTCHTTVTRYSSSISSMFCFDLILFNRKEVENR